MITKTLGGNRLGAGNKMKVELKNYERSTFDMGYIWRSTMAVGTLVPFLKELALPGDTFDIKLDAIIKTLPTQGPLFGSMKVQLDVFSAPIRLYNSWLHNNRLDIGNNMADVKLPIMTLKAEPTNNNSVILAQDLDNMQINPSCILAYLGMRGVGQTKSAGQTRAFNAIPLLAYWDIYKNYYANKQEEIGAVIHTVIPAQANISQINITVGGVPGSTTILPESPATGAVTVNGEARYIQLTYTGTITNFTQVMVRTSQYGDINLQELVTGNGGSSVAGTWTGYYDFAKWGTLTLINWRDRASTDPLFIQPDVVTFPLSNLDTMRNNILLSPGNVGYDIMTANLYPYKYLTEANSDGIAKNMTLGQEGLGVKTYQSDQFNNWLQTEWITGSNGITDVTRVSTTSGSFTIDALNIAQKVYDMLNRIAVSGGTYDDWLDAVYMEERYTRPSTPIYCGGLSKELVFQEVVSNAEANNNPLGSLAGKGIMANKHKGGTIRIKVQEPSYIIGIISITPRLDYSQGNDWDVNLKTMDDFHKPALDQIGFQDLIMEQMAWWTTFGTTSNWQQRSAGKQPAWTNYMTNVNKTYGNFAVTNNQMFMTLNRRYEAGMVGSNIQMLDVTTYIDPAKYNFIFAQASADAQNYWAQIGIDMEVRRKMSSKLMPAL